MKKKNYWLAAALIVGMSACSNDETENGNPVDTRVARFSASIEELHTRAYDQTWEAVDEIGISGTSGGKVYTNIRYSTTGDGTFTARGENIYYENNDEVTFTAYYPWNEILPAFGMDITADTRAQANQKKFDYLYATGIGSKAKPVDFTFHHKMSKLVLKVKAGTDMTFDEVKGAACSLGNFLYEGTFDRTTGAATASGTASGAWTFVRNTTDTDYNTPTIEEDAAAGTMLYTLILFPQTFGDNQKLKFTVTRTGGVKHSVEIDLGEIKDHPTNELKPGTQYNITVNVNKTGLSIGTAAISGWETKSHTVDAEME